MKEITERFRHRQVVERRPRELDVAGVLRRRGVRDDGHVTDGGSDRVLVVVDGITGRPQDEVVGVHPPYLGTAEHRVGATGTQREVANVDVGATTDLKSGDGPVKITFDPAEGTLSTNFHCPAGGGVDLVLPRTTATPPPPWEWC